MALIENQRFVGERVDLDGNDYLRCTFKECELVYSGVGSVGLDDCVFASCEWSLDGAASATMRFLRGVYHGVATTANRWSRPCSPKSAAHLPSEASLHA